MTVIIIFLRCFLKYPSGHSSQNKSTHRYEKKNGNHMNIAINSSFRNLVFYTNFLVQNSFPSDKLVIQ